jgi:acyl-CoA synthetase (AMP-forming)/AMP-acid ligase II
LQRFGTLLPDLPLRRSGLPESLSSLPASIPDALRARARSADDEFVIGRDFRLTYGEADDRSLSLASQLLAAGIGKGSRVGVLFPNGPDWVVTWLAAARIGALTVPLSTFAPGAELARAIRQTDVHALLTTSAFREGELLDRLEDGLEGLSRSGPELELEAAPFLRWMNVDGISRSWSHQLDGMKPRELVLAAQGEVSPADALVIMSTSGATAAPKAVVHTHGSLVRHAALLAERRELTAQDRIFSPMPFFWAGGLTMVVLAALTSGGAAVVQERFDAGEALELAERERVTQISCWPNTARAMADHPSFAARDLSSVRGGTLTEALPAARRPPGPGLAPTPLGMTETGGPHTAHDDSYAPLPESLRGSFGRSLPGMEHRVVDRETGIEAIGDEEGELLVRGVFLMDGLYKRERHEAFTPDGWYPTGDLGRLDVDGHVRFTGRHTAMIKTGGSNVSPGEVEDVLCGLPGVRTAHVFGVPAGDRGEDVAAAVVPEAGRSPEVSELVAAARMTLSAYKVPRHIRIVSAAEVPTLPTGKVDLVRLRALFADER